MKKFLTFYLFIFLFIINTGTAQTGNTINQTCLINSVILKSKTVIVEADFVQMLTGNAAIKEAKKAGEAEYDLNKKGDTTWYVPNDYYVLNENTKLRQLAVSPGAQIFLVKEGSSALTKSNITRLQKSFEGKLFKITLVKGLITNITEIYTP